MTLALRAKPASHHLQSCIRRLQQRQWPIASGCALTSASRRSWRIDSMPVVSCQVVSESVTIFSTLDVLSLRSYRSRDDVPERRASQGDLRGAWKQQPKIKECPQKPLLPT
jgi:hypothetical protein